ncbi:MAG: ABC transporter substrate-binding protein [Opitutales bacterium]|nr:ABC transporter substrate-binding protein [Opitutales bacterium]MCH8539442.1 ABC transporter substrate-binding protein [Opitutales bacterium]
MKNRLLQKLLRPLALLGVGIGGSSMLSAEPLRIAYSDWPGWVAWEIGIQKGWFAEEGVDVEFLWFDYVASMDAYAAGQVDAVTVTNGDMLVTGATGKPSVAILINDISNGNDMIVARPGIETIADLEGKTIGVEEGFVCHLLLLKGLESVGLSADDVTIINTPTEETPQVLASGAVDAIGAWQPNSGQALRSVADSTPVYTSADVPGLIYDLLVVDPATLEDRRDDWMAVVRVWYRIVDYLMDDDNFDEALAILANRVQVSPEEYEALFFGTKILTLEQALEAWEPGEGLDSVFGSSDVVNAFNVSNGVYDELLDVENYFDPSLVREFAESLEE